MYVQHTYFTFSCSLCLQQICKWDEAASTFSLRTLSYATAEVARHAGQPDCVPLIALVHHLGGVVPMLDLALDLDWTCPSHRVLELLDVRLPKVHPSVTVTKDSAPKACALSIVVSCRLSWRGNGLNTCITCCNTTITQFQRKVWR
jgi:hypothetical protein